MIVVVFFFTLLTDRASTIYPVIYYVIANPVVRGLSTGQEYLQRDIIIIFFNAATRA